MARYTSIQAYYHVKNSGVLSLRRWEVYHAILQLGRVTSAEAFKSQLNDGLGGMTQSRARFTELRDMGFIYEDGTKVCNVTGRTAIAWRICTELPDVLVKKKPKTVKQKKVDEVLDKLRLAWVLVENNAFATPETEEAKDYITEAADIIKTI